MLSVRVSGAAAAARSSITDGLREFHGGGAVVRRGRGGRWAGRAGLTVENSAAMLKKDMWPTRTTVGAPANTCHALRALTLPWPNASATTASQLRSAIRAAAAIAIVQSWPVCRGEDLRHR